MDFASGRLVSPPRDPGLQFASIGAGTFGWSANGQSFATSSRGRLTVKDVVTGAVREIRQRSGRCGDWLQWSGDGSFFICYGAYIEPREEVRPGIVRMDPATGQVTYVAAGRAPALARGGRTVYLLRDLEQQPDGKGVALVEHQLATGVERELMRRESLALLSLSPDGRLAATISRTASSSTNALLLVPVSGDGAREVLSLRRGETFGPGHGGLFWAPDGRSVFVMKSASGAKPTFIRVALDGTVTNHPDLGPGDNVRVHPDGRQIAFSVPAENVVEVNRLEGIANRR